MDKIGANLMYVGYSSHDDEVHYKCPFCEQTYGSWGLLKIRKDNGDTFKCEKCGKLLHYS